MNEQRNSKRQGKDYVTEYIYKFMPPHSQLQTLYQIKGACIINYFGKKLKEGINS